MSRVRRFLTTYRLLAVLVLLMLCMAALMVFVRLHTALPFEKRFSDVADLLVSYDRESKPVLTPQPEKSQPVLTVQDATATYANAAKNRAEIERLYSEYKILLQTVEADWQKLYDADWHEPQPELDALLEKIIPLIIRLDELKESMPAYAFAALKDEFNAEYLYETSFLHADALRLMHRNRPEEAVQRIQLFIESWGYWRTTDPCPISELWGQLAGNNHCANLLSTFIEHYPDQQYLDFALKELEPLDPNSIPGRELVMRCFQLAENNIANTGSFVSQLRHDYPDHRFDDPISLLANRPGEFLHQLSRRGEWRQEQLLRHNALIEFHDQMQPHLDEPFPQLVAAATRIIDQCGADVPIGNRTYNWQYFSLPTELLNKVCGTAQFVDHINGCAIKAALLTYRNRHETFPDSLDALVPEILSSMPLDTFTGNRFIYRRTDNGFKLYSPGPDGVDNGGTPAPSARYDALRGFDITFNYPGE